MPTVRGTDATVAGHLRRDGDDNPANPQRAGAYVSNNFAWMIRLFDVAIKTVFIPSYDAIGPREEVPTSSRALGAPFYQNENRAAWQPRLQAGVRLAPNFLLVPRHTPANLKGGAAWLI